MSSKKPTTMTIPVATDTVSIESYIKKEGWKTVHNPPSKLKAGMELDLVELIDTDGIEGLYDPEQSVSGKEALKRLRLLGADISLEDAVLLLDEQKSIPSDWRPHYILTGFVCEDSGGDLQVLGLYWCGDQWGWRFDRVDGDFGDHYRGVRPANNLAPS